MSVPNGPPGPNRKDKYVSFEDPITTLTGPSSSSASTEAVLVVSTRSPSQAATVAGNMPPTQAGPMQPVQLPAYRPVSRVYAGPRSDLQARFQAAPTSTSFSEHVNQTTNVVFAGVRSQNLLRPDQITPVHEAVGHVASGSARNPVNHSMGIASADSTPWITNLNAPLPLESSASNTHGQFSSFEGRSMHGPPNRDNQAPNQEESRPLSTVEDPVASSALYRDDPLDELRYLMCEHRASAGNGYNTQPFMPAMPSITHTFSPAVSSTTQPFRTALPLINQPPPPGLATIRPSATTYRHVAYPAASSAASYVATEGPFAGLSSNRSAPYMGSNSFAPQSAGRDPHARTSGLSRPGFLAEGYASTGPPAARPSPQSGSGLTNLQNIVATTSGRPPCADQNYQGNLYNEHGCSGPRGEVDEENFGFPGQIPCRQNPSHHGPHQQCPGHHSLSMGYGGGLDQQPGRSGMQEIHGPMHAQPRPGNRHGQGVLFREPSRNRQVFQHRPRTPYTPAPSPSAYLLFEDPPGTVIPDNEGLNPYELRDREAAAEALLRLNSEDEGEVDLTLERLHSRRRRLENEAQALRLQQDEDRVWNLLDQKEAKKSHRG